MKKDMLILLLTLAVLTAFAPVANAQDARDSAAASQSHQEQENQKPHHCAMEMQAHGDMGMGFSQAKTTHHFLLSKEGGVIGVEANDPADTESRDQIRMHLAHIAKAFAAGDFDIPMFVHDQVPPGVPVLKAKKSQIEYRFRREQVGRAGAYQ